MLNFIITILVGIILFLIGIIINITENFSTDVYWVGVILLVLGISVIIVSILGKIKNWF
jgi:hypothetical protein